MNTPEKLGVTVANPEQEIRVEGATFAEVIAFLALHLETLKKASTLLQQENRYSENERLAEVQGAMAAMVNTMSVMLFEHLRWAREQGLRFELSSSGQRSH